MSFISSSFLHLTYENFGSLTFGVCLQQKKKLFFIEWKIKVGPLYGINDSNV